MKKMNEYINYIKTEKNVEELQKEFVNNFISFRKENNLTQGMLAEYSNISRVKVARIESNMHSPSINSLIEILGPIGYTVKIEKITK